MKNARMCGSFESFLEDEGIREQVEDVEQKRVFAWQIQQAMETSRITRSETAERTRTSRNQV